MNRYACPAETLTSFDTVFSCDEDMFSSDDRGMEETNPSNAFTECQNSRLIKVFSNAFGSRDGD